MTALGIPRPATIGQAIAWWTTYGLFRLHFALCKWHMRRAEAMKAKCPWLVWARVRIHGGDNHA